MSRNSELHNLRGRECDTVTLNAATKFQTQIGSPRSPRTGNSDESATIVVIEKRAFFRDCVTQCLRMLSDFNVISVTSMQEWHDVSKRSTASMILLCTDGKAPDQRDIDSISQSASPLPVVVVSDFEEVGQIVEVIGKGARGYVPTNTSVVVAVEAMKMVIAGGTFVPASTLLAAHKVSDWAKDQHRPLQSLFTARQASVVEALRMGKANKTIAYELNMCESTVKVHVRNIMKKLRARNRTQVAYLANELLTKAGAQ